MGFPDEFYVHTATVQTYQGNGAAGPSFADPVTVACYIEATAALSAGSGGEQVTARSTTLYCSLDYQSAFTAESVVTSDQLGGKPARVLTVNPLDAGPLGLPNHVEVTLL